MNGFYLRVNKKARTGMELFSSTYESLIARDPVDLHGLTILDDKHMQIAQSNGYTAFSIGTFIYENQWGEKALELVLRRLKDGKSIGEIMPDTRGQFCLVLRISSDVFVITDKLGSFPIYVFEDNHTIQMSNLIFYMAKNNPVSVNHQSCAEYLSFDSCFGSTFFNEIDRLDMATIYQVGNERKAQVYDDVFLDVDFNKHTDLNELAHTIKDTLVHNLAFLSSNDKIFVDITGGFDTRTVSSLLHSMDVAFQAGICGEQILRETELAARVAQTLGVTLCSNIKIKNRNHFKTILEKHLVIGTGVPVPYHSSELINYYDNISLSFDIHVTGIGGTELTTQDLPKLNLFSSKIAKQSLIQKNFRYHDIFTRKFMTKARYHDHLAATIDSLMQRIGSNVHNEVANFLRFSNVSRNYHGSLIGTHNVIMPFYSPFLEGNYVRLMMETSYKLKDYHRIQRTILTELNSAVSSIMTTHGYSANILSRKGNSTLDISKKRVRAFGRQLIYSLRFLEKAAKWVDAIKRKIKPPIQIEELQRSFWVDEIDKAWSDDMRIFEIVDQNKLNKHLSNKKKALKLKGRILYLDRMINECNAKL